MNGDLAHTPDPVVLDGLLGEGKSYTRGVFGDAFGQPDFRRQAGGDPVQALE